MISAACWSGKAAARYDEHRMRKLLLCGVLVSGCVPRGEAVPSAHHAVKPSYEAHQWSSPTTWEHPAVAFVRAQNGTPYCWGGTGPECFDCSGLTYMAWAAAGKAIPRTSDGQRQKLASIGWEHLQPGDILWRPGHVGLYVGNGWAMHAPGTGKHVRYQPANKYRAVLRPH